MFEIGNSLREARVRQGLDYMDVELATKVRAKYLQALEDERFELLPAQPYVKGFLRTYAEFLGLDGQLYVDEYNSRYVVDGFEDIAPRHVSPRSRRQHGVERRALLLALVGICALTALVIVAWKFGGGDTAAPTSTGGTRPKPSAPARGMRLNAVGKGTYVEIRRASAAGKVLFQGTIGRGRAKLVPGSRFWLYVRRPARLNVSLGGKAVALPARRNLKVLVTPNRTARAGG